MYREKRTPKQDSKKGSRAVVKEKTAEKIKVRKTKEKIKQDTKKKRSKKAKKKNGRKPSANVVARLRTAKTSN